MTGRGAAVVVAVAHGHCTDDAVEWAAAEAAARNCPLRIIHVVSPPVPIDPWGLIPPPGDPLGTAVVGEQVLDVARRRAEAVATDLEISTHLRAGSVAQVLLRAGEEAALLVVGGLRRGAVRRMLTGSVSRQVLGQARCPVAVVHPRPGLEEGPPGLG